MIHIPDLVNGLFECVGGLSLLKNVKRIRRDKQVRGTVWEITIFFTAWGYWNMFYYPNLDQWISFAGGCVICLANTVWVFYAYKYRRN